MRTAFHWWRIIGSADMTNADFAAAAQMADRSGFDMIDASAGQTSAQGTLVYGNVYEADHVNSSLMADRTDPVCIAHPHPAAPYWTLHAATNLGDRQDNWSLPYHAGRDQAWCFADHEAEMGVTV